jgi:hypothetical protein
MHTGEPSEDVHAQLLNEAFSADFKGDALELFCRAMGGYADAYNHDEYYGRIIAWYGPSGAGKSKALDALKDKVRAEYRFPLAVSYIVKVPDLYYLLSVLR